MSKLGFIGMGAMGTPMAENLIRKSGMPLIAYDINAEALRSLAEKGALEAADNQQVAMEADVIITMLPRSEHVRQVVEQILPCLRKGQLLIDMSTISASVSRDLAGQVAQTGAVMIDAPVVKSRPAAIAGKLGIYVGGPVEAYERALPLLKMMGENVIRLGDNGAGLTMKICHNALVAQIQCAVYDAMKLAKEAGDISIGDFITAASYGGAQNFYMDSKQKALENRDFTPAFALEYMHKDVFLALDLCKEEGLTLEGIERAGRVYSAALAEGIGREDFSAIVKLWDK